MPTLQITQGCGTPSHSPIWPRTKSGPPAPSLYLPEVLFVVFFIWIWLLCSGSRRFSVDYWLAVQL